MGMDSVELVLAFEEEFDIEIPDDKAEKMQTVGDVADFVAMELVRLGRPADGLDIFLRIRGRTVEILGGDPQRITRSSHFVDDLGLN